MNIYEKKTETLGEWKAILDKEGDNVSIVITHKDNKPHEIESDAISEMDGEQYEVLGMRFSSEEIEEDYQNTGEPRVEPEAKALSIIHNRLMWDVAVYLDDDNHLTIHAENSEVSFDIEQIENKIIFKVQAV